MKWKTPGTYNQQQNLKYKICTCHKVICHIDCHLVCLVLNQCHIKNICKGYSRSVLQSINKLVIFKNVKSFVVVIKVTSITCQ